MDQLSPEVAEGYAEMRSIILTKKLNDERTIHSLDVLHTTYSPKRKHKGNTVIINKLLHKEGVYFSQGFNSLARRLRGFRYCKEYNVLRKQFIRSLGYHARCTSGIISV